MSSRPPVPVGFRLALDADTRVLAGGSVVVGGEPRRVLRLTSRGAELLAGWRRGTAVTGEAGGALARRLVEAGAAHPVPPSPRAVSLSVVVPAFDRPADLAACLGSLGHEFPVVVTDDGSADPDAIAAVAREYGAHLISSRTNRGPAAARNAGVAALDSDLVAFADSDSRPTAAALWSLAAHFADPVVGAAAPRVVASAGADGVCERFVAARSPLDLRDRPSSVRPATRVSYVPSTVLVVRRAAFQDVGGFDETLRYGEDVDVVWRLVDAGWVVRYDPSVAVGHREPATWKAVLRRRFRYGTSAGPLAARHPRHMRGPALAGLAAPVTVLRAVPRLADVPIGAAGVLGPAVSAPARTSLGLLRWGVPLWWPLLGLLALRSRRHLAMAVALGCAPALADFCDRRPRLDPVRWLLASLTDDIAYGLGVWRGCIRVRAFAPLRPRLGAPSRSRSDGGHYRRAARTP